MTERLRRMERRASNVPAQTDPGAENDRIDVAGDEASLDKCQADPAALKDAVKK